MSKLLRLTGWLLLTALVIWALVIGYWKMTGVRPDARDLTLYLGVLPLGTFAVLALLTRGLAGARAKATSASDESSMGTDAAASGASLEQAPTVRLNILASALRLPAGQNAAAALSQSSNPSSPKLHDKLRDASGFPVFASWSEDTDDQMAETVLGAITPHRLDEEQLRAIALLIPVLQDLLLATADTNVQRDDSGDVGVSPATSHILVSVFVPADWSAPVRDAVAGWIRNEAAEHGFAAARLDTRIVPASSPADVWHAIGDIGEQPETPACLHLLLACHSQVGERSVQRLDGSGLLMSARQPEGIVPGEGAAGVLLQTAADKDAADRTPMAVLSAFASVQQGVSWQSRAALSQVEELLTKTLARAPGTTAETLKALLSDADLRRSRATTAASFFAASLQHLDAESDCIAIGGACGHLGLVSPLALLALAAEKATASDGPVVALAMAEPDQRAMALVLPPDVPAADAQATALISNPQAT